MIDNEKCVLSNINDIAKRSEVENGLEKASKEAGSN
jgi:hypothetical protein